MSIDYPIRTNRRSGPGSGAGFTLIELMMVLIILSVVLTIVLPGFNTLTQRTSLKSYTNEFITSVILTRSEAIKRNTQMDLCIVQDSENPTSCGSSGNWEEGWLVKDPNSPNIVRFQQPLSYDLQLFAISSTPYSTLSFDSRGLGNSPHQFKLCKPGGVEVKQISVSTTGRTRIETCPSASCSCDTSSACSSSDCYD